MTPRPRARCQAALFTNLVIIATMYANQAYAIEQLVTIETRPGVTMNYMRVAPSGTPVAVAILLPGGGGKLVTWKTGRILRGGNFLIRTRNAFAAGQMVAIAVDVPSDRRKKGLKGFRHKKKYLKDLKALIRHVRWTEKLPVWLVGTSRGTLSAAFAGRLLDPAKGDGVVLTSSLTRGLRRLQTTVFDAPLDRIAVPVLVVHNKQDRCEATPYEDAPGIVARLTAARTRELITFDGGDDGGGRACGGKSAHGFQGMEQRVVNAITAWMRRHAVR